MYLLANQLELGLYTPSLPFPNFSTSESHGCRILAEIRSLTSTTMKSEIAYTPGMIDSVYVPVLISFECAPGKISEGRASVL